MYQFQVYQICSDGEVIKNGKVYGKDAQEALKKAYASLKAEDGTVSVWRVKRN